jgi:Ni/Co efflux regulator RcnB
MKKLITAALLAAALVAASGAVAQAKDSQWNRAHGHHAKDSQWNQAGLWTRGYRADNSSWPPR